MKKHLKKLFALLMCAILMMSSMLTVHAEEQEITVTEIFDELDFYDEADILNDFMVGVPVEVDIDLDGDENPEKSLEVETNDLYCNDNADTYDYYCDDYRYHVNNGILSSFDFLSESAKAVGHFDIPEGITAIELYAFSSEGLKSVTFPSTLTSIGSSAFSDNLFESITIPGHIKTIDSYAFRDCKELRAATLLEGTVMGYGMFYGCDKLQSISIPGSVGVIEKQAFCDMPLLETVTISEGVTEIGDLSFQSCHSLKYLTLPDSVTKIGIQAFYDCPLLTLTNEKLPANLVTIDSNAFKQCASLTLNDSAFPKSLKKLDSEVFCECTSLKTINLPFGLEEMVYGEFLGCTGITSATIPGTLKTLSQNTFHGCSSLENVTLAEGLETIEYGAFMGCAKLKSITIPASVTKIEGFAMGFPVGSFEPYEGFTIYGKAGSEAERYANEYGIEFDDGTIKPKSITITNGKSAEIEVDKTLQLKTSVKPRDAKTTLTWKSNNENVATVSSKGLVKGIGKGKATVTVTTANGKSAKITIKVIARKPSKVTITNGKKATVKVGKTLQLKTKLSPANAETKLTWTSSNTKVATVSSKGVVKGVKAGTAKITVKTANGKKATITITVK